VERSSSVAGSASALHPSEPRSARRTRRRLARQPLPNSQILIHQPTAGFEGQATDIEIHANEVLKTRQRIDELYAKHSGQSEQRVRADMERDRFFKSEQAREYGLIDRVIYRH
jgi:ATP-dependent Clp protease protease subunit